MEHLPSMQYLVAAALGLGLAACSGFRIFVPLLAASVAHHVGWLPAAPGFAWLGSWPAMVTLAVATVFEVAGFYVPVVDNLLDNIAIPTSFIAGGLLMTSSLPHLDPAVRWTLGMLVGGGTAGLVQISTALLRTGSTVATAGLTNSLLATLENVVAVLGSLLALLLPVVAAGLALALVAWLLKWVWRWRQLKALSADEQH